MISAEAFRKIKAVVLDVDGVLTDGRAGYGAEEEIKFFHLRDGHWMRMALRTGLKVGLLSGRGSRANRRRAEELGLSFCYENCKDKLEGFERDLAAVVVELINVSFQEGAEGCTHTVTTEDMETFFRERGREAAFHKLAWIWECICWWCNQAYQAGKEVSLHE